LSIIDSIIYGIGTLPEAKIGPVKEGQKEGWILEGYTHLPPTIQISSSVHRKARRPGSLNAGPDI